jgi:hypothetical protein
MSLPTRVPFEWFFAPNRGLGERAWMTRHWKGRSVIAKSMVGEEDVVRFPVAAEAPA